MRARGWRLRFEGSQVVGNDGPGAKLTHAGAWHAGFGRTVGLTGRSVRERQERTIPERGSGHVKRGKIPPNDVH